MTEEQASKLKPGDEVLADIKKEIDIRCVVRRVFNPKDEFDGHGRWHLLLRRIGSNHTFGRELYGVRLPDAEPDGGPHPMKAELPVVGEDGEEPLRAERCETCKWWVEIGNNGHDWGFTSDEAFGVCKRYPPKHDAPSCHERRAGCDPDKWNYPATWLWDFCGEWAAIPVPAGG